jgi:dihydroorotase-like cyclic amidohydrolase
MGFDTVIRGGEVVIAKVGINALDIAISDGKIAALLAPGADMEAGDQIDARGKYVLQGVIDPNTWVTCPPSRSRARKITASRRSAARR